MHDIITTFHISSQNHWNYVVDCESNISRTVISSFSLFALDDCHVFR